LKKGYPNLKEKSEKPKISLTLRQTKLVSEGNFMTVFNEVHNSHLNSSVGIVSILIDNKKWIIDYAYGIKMNNRLCIWH